LFDGILTGLLLQLAVGPVFFYILGITIGSNYLESIFAIIAVTLVDFIYIILSIIGIGKFLQKSKYEKLFGLISAVVLVIFGIMISYKGLNFINKNINNPSLSWTPLKSFISCFILTISSPLTIVFWSSIFSTKAIEKQYKENQLILFGFGAGSSTFIFLSITMFILSLVKAHIPNLIVQVLNCIVGLALIYYGINRSIKSVKKFD
jgi:threonine/homoserine/homoserine lactone efflux protein